MMQRRSVIIHRHLLATWCLFGALVSLAACSRQPHYDAPPIEGENIVIQTAPLPLDIPQFYTYHTEGKDVNFFVIRMHDRVLSFLDACITCYPRKLGYRHEEGSVTCRACDTRYSIYRLEKGFGGCFPIRIDGRPENSRYVIARAALDRHAGKF